MKVRLLILLLYLNSVSQTVADKETTKSDPAEEREGKEPVKAEATVPAKITKVPGSRDEASKGQSDHKEAIKLPLRMPNVTTKEHDTYLMTPVKVDYDDAYIVGYIPQVCV